MAQVPEGQPLIALTHNPDIFPNVPQRVQLVLAGHTHGGQVRFPVIGPVIESSDYGDRWVRGHVFEDNHHLFVTTGIGTSIMPVRFGLPPEIVLLTLRSPLPSKLFFSGGKKSPQAAPVTDRTRKKSATQQLTLTVH